MRGVINLLDNILSFHCIVYIEHSLQEKLRNNYLLLLVTRYETNLILHVEYPNKSYYLEFNVFLSLHGGFHDSNTLLKV